MTKKMPTIQVHEEIGCNIKNTRAFSTNNGEMVLVIDLKNTHSKSKKEVVNEYKTIGTHYIPKEGQKGKESIFITPLTTENSYQRYDTINMNGINYKVQLNTKIEQEEIERLTKTDPKKVNKEATPTLTEEDAVLFQQFLQFKKMLEMEAAQK